MTALMALDGATLSDRAAWGAVVADSSLLIGEVEFRTGRRNKTLMHPATWELIRTDDEVGRTFAYAADDMRTTSRKSKGEVKVMRRIVADAGRFGAPSQTEGVLVPDTTALREKMTSLVAQMVAMAQAEHDPSPAQVSAFTHRYVACRDAVDGLTQELLALQGMLEVAGCQLREFNE